MKINKRSKQGLPLKAITTNVATTLSTAGLITVITQPVQGLGTAQRTGDEINVENIELCFLSYYGDNVNVVRYIVLQIEGITPGLALSTFLQNGASGTPDITSLYVPFYEGRFFHVLYDKTIVLSQNASNSAVIDRQVLKPKIPIIPYVPGSTTVVDGDILIVALSDSGIVPNPSYDFTCRMWFRDI